jgi:hypothetical protein
VVVAVVLFVRRVRPRVALVANARPAGRAAPTPDRVTRELTHVFLQRKLLQKLGPGLMHAFIFWGFIVLLPTIAEAAVAIVDRESTLPLLGGASWFAFLSDVFATLVIVGIAMAFFIRKVVKPDRFRGSHMEEADRILLLILAIVVTFLLWNATRIALGIAEVPDARPVANLLSGVFGAGDGTEVAERVLVWAHLLVILGFLVFLPGSKHLHIATAPANVWLVGDRQAALAEAPDHGPARSRGRRAGRRGRAPAARPERRDRPGRVGLRNVRRVRARVPGGHRAHRHDRRPSTEPRDGGVEVPAGGGRDAPRRREPGEPVGPAGVGAP